MKKIYMITAAVMAASCSVEDAGQPAMETGMQRLSITVEDSGYAMTGGGQYGTFAAAPPVRAAEDGLRTEFSAGDACGLYVVRNGEVAVANVKVTASDNSGTLAWSIDNTAGTLWHEPGDRYFLYYPWQSAPVSAPLAGDAFDVNGDAEFFSGMADGWLPADNQSTYAAYTASDLMTAETSAGTASGWIFSLRFSMTHRMALAVIDFPKTVYISEEEGVPDYTEYSVPVFSGSAQPYMMPDHTWRYIFNPDDATLVIAGTYSDGARSFSFSPSAPAGSCRIYRIDGAAVTERPAGTFADAL